MHSFVDLDGLRITSQPSLKILGFMIAGDLSMGDHVGLVSRKFYASLWKLRHLKRVGITARDLVKIYSTALRPIIEYAAQVYASMLTAAQEEIIERMQRTALKIIYGPGYSYRETILESGLEKLSERRETLARKFAISTYENQRYAHWFPKNEEIPHDLRKRLTIKETRPRTERMRKSSVYQMVKIINSL